jgi:hypothetical protein
MQQMQSPTCNIDRHVTSIAVDFGRIFRSLFGATSRREDAAH